MKGIDIVVRGSVGHMSAFMAQAGVLDEAPPELVRANEARVVGAIMTQLQAMQSDPAIVVVGEDLGTVEDWIQDYLLHRGIMGTSILSGVIGAKTLAAFALGLALFIKAGAGFGVS